MTEPVHTQSMVSPVWLRADLPREVSTTYWAESHAGIVKKLPNLAEYVQRLLSAVDHGYWPATHRVSTMIAPSWRVDGFAEIRFRSTAGTLLTAIRAREVYLDEQNVFSRVLGQPTWPGGGRWWTAGHDDAVPHRTAVLLRRRRGVSGRAFRRFVGDALGSALHRAGARDLRAYSFMPFTRFVHPTPGVAHDYPVCHRYHGSLVIGADSREHVTELLRAPEVSAVIAGQAEVLTAAHAYTVERSVPVVRMVSEERMYNS